ncbi:MAG: hypothetical protein M0R06_18315 [Sphaerochaeta sp.]|nr:hypothetical protein [Sphaerochaeta sp.]
MVELRMAVVFGGITVLVSTQFQAGIAVLWGMCCGLAAALISIDMSTKPFMSLWEDFKGFVYFVIGMVLGMILLYVATGMSN